MLKKTSKNEDQQNKATTTKVPGQPLRCSHASSTWQGHGKAVNSQTQMRAWEL